MYKANPNNLLCLMKEWWEHRASLKEPTLAIKSGMMGWKNYNLLNKTGIQESTVIGKKEETEEKTSPYRKKLTNKRRMNCGMRKPLSKHHSNNWSTDVLKLVSASLRNYRTFIWSQYKEKLLTICTVERPGRYHTKKIINVNTSNRKNPHPVPNIMHCEENSITSMTFRPIIMTIRRNIVQTQTGLCSSKEPQCPNTQRKTEYPDQRRLKRTTENKWSRIFFLWRMLLTDERDLRTR